jgi:hypothetical protein
MQSGLDPATLNKQPPISAPPTSEGEIAHYTPGQYLDKAINLVGSKLRQAAGVVREHTPNEGIAKSVVSSTSSALDATGRFILREGSDDGASGDTVSGAEGALEAKQGELTLPVLSALRKVVRRYPLRALAASALAGFLLGGLTRD